MSLWRLTLERYRAPTSTVTRHGDTIYVTGAPPFDPETGAIFLGPIERQTEPRAGADGELCVETAGSSLDNILKVNVLYRHLVVMRSPRSTTSIGASSRRNRPRGSSSMCLPGTGIRHRGGLRRRHLTRRCFGGQWLEERDGVLLIFEVHPRRDQWDAYLGHAKMLRPELEGIAGFIDNFRYRSLTREGWISSLSRLARREGRRSLAHEDAAPRGAGERPARRSCRTITCASVRSTQDTQIPEGHTLQEQRLDDEARPRSARARPSPWSPRGGRTTRRDRPARSAAPSSSASMLARTAWSRGTCSTPF